MNKVCFVYRLVEMKRLMLSLANCYGRLVIVIIGDFLVSCNTEKVAMFPRPDFFL